MSDGSILQLTLAAVCYSAICTGTGTVAGTGTGTGSILQLPLAEVDLPLPLNPNPNPTAAATPTPTATQIHLPRVDLVSLRVTADEEESAVGFGRVRFAA